MTKIHGEFLYLDPEETRLRRSWAYIRETERYLAELLATRVQLLDWISRQNYFAFDDAGVIELARRGKQWHEC